MNQRRVTARAGVKAPAVLLISPGIVRWSDLDFGLPHLVALGGYLREHTGVRVQILDLNLEGGDPATLAQTLRDNGPYVLVGIAAYTSFDVLRVRALARFVREVVPGVPLVAGGYHASALPMDLVGPGMPFDAVIPGEGERPLAAMVQTLLGGGKLQDTVVPREVVARMDDLPPYAWDLLDRYWPRAKDVGRKLQIYLSRGCTYHCTFCMERAKSGYSWRAFSPDRAVDELKRLASYTDLSHWVVNLADPLFGFQRRWRKTVLKGILDAGIKPRQFWTLTRSDDLDEEDVKLLAAARFSIGIGMESGSPRMLKVMQKGNQPERYKDALRRLARLSRQHGLSWAANVIVGHPGEDMASMKETHAFVTELFATAKETAGWVSIDPFRLYPGSAVHEQLSAWEDTHGARFYHPTWWESWYDGAFRAQHLDPSATLSYEDRVRFLYDAYPPLIAAVQERFVGQGRSVDRVFARSLAEQRQGLSPARRDQLLAMGRRAKQQPTVHRGRGAAVSLPLGLNMKDPHARALENAVRRLMDAGVLVTTDLVAALLAASPYDHLPEATATQVLSGKVVRPAREGDAVAALPVDVVVAGLEALAVAPGDTVLDATGGSGWVAAVLSALVGDEGRVVCRVADPGSALHAAARALPNVHLRLHDPHKPLAVSEAERGTYDAVWMGACVPRVPRGLKAALVPSDGKLVTVVGPRFRTQDLVVHTSRAAQTTERIVRRVRVPVYGGHGGWVPRRPRVEVLSTTASQRAHAVLSAVDLGADAAGLYDPEAASGPWASALAEAWRVADRPLAVVPMLLLYDTVPDLLAALRTPPAALRDAGGQALCEALRHGLEALADHPVAAAPDLSGVLSDLAPLRRLIWQAQPAPPPLRLLHVPALGRRARATTVRGARVIATDLCQPADHLLMQLVHEEMHPVTDPHVLAEYGQDLQRDTRPGREGLALHRALEHVAVAATEALLRAKAPHWLPAFVAWQQP